MSRGITPDGKWKWIGLGSSLYILKRRKIEEILEDIGER